MVSQVVIVGSAAAGVLVIAVLFRKLRSRKKAKKTVPNGTVLLHQFPPMRGSVVNASPPCLKLETYLRMAKIPYEIDDSGRQLSKKGKMPWIAYSGESIEFAINAVGVNSGFPAFIRSLVFIRTRTRKCYMSFF